MDRKEELVLKHCDKSSTFCHIDESQFIIDGSGYPIADAMDEYAKEQSIAFDRFKRDNIYTIDADGETYHKLIIDGDNARTEQYPFDYVYAQFIESQNKGQ